VDEFGPWAKTLIRIEFLKNAFYPLLRRSEIDGGAGEQDARIIVPGKDSARLTGRAEAGDESLTRFRINDRVCHCLCPSCYRVRATPSPLGDEHRKLTVYATC